MNNFPIGYYQRPSNTRIWVQGDTGAKSYLVAPNTTVDLWDTERQTIYIKSADASGMPSMTTIDYTFRENAPSPEYVTHEELKELRNYIDSKLGGDEDDE